MIRKVKQYTPGAPSAKVTMVDDNELITFLVRAICDLTDIRIEGPNSTLELVHYDSEEGEVEWAFLETLHSEEAEEGYSGFAFEVAVSEYAGYIVRELTSTLWGQG